ncbi:MAG: hypothetical protein Ct9H300mP28_22860 [Pseudomonadota bacterium]|nr:MAG: hypothetical protein Ct9H300mP28_22860 [Pseudomonadota bacterium]
MGFVKQLCFFQYREKMISGKHGIFPYYWGIQFFLYLLKPGFNFLELFPDIGQFLFTVCFNLQICSFNV